MRDRPTQGFAARRPVRVRLRELPVVVRILLVVAATGAGLILGFGLGLGLIRVLQAIVGEFPTHSVRGLIVIASAYALTGVAGLAGLLAAWRGLFRRSGKRRSRTE